MLGQFLIPHHALCHIIFGREGDRATYFPEMHDEHILCLCE
jgi:hypothetical protein